MRFDQLAKQFAQAKPFLHVIIDGFLRPEVFDKMHDKARIVLAIVDASNEITQPKKVACTEGERFGTVTWQVVSHLNSLAFSELL